MSWFPDSMWFEVSNRDPRVVGLYSRHYSAIKNGSTIGDWLRHGISPPGQDVTMLTSESAALFGWLKQNVRDDGQEGVQCYVFRNEGPMLSSNLIRDACDIAWRYWPGERLWTYVNPDFIQSVNPGYCFKKAGWELLPERSKAGLVILQCVLQ